MKQDQEAKNVILNAKNVCKRGNSIIIICEKNQNPGWLAQALFKMKYDRKMRGFKSSESIIGN